jgi:rhodanese-related sulfurtransferase
MIRFWAGFCGIILLLIGCASQHSNPANNGEQISAKEVKAILGSPQEYALIDVREEGDFSHGHQLLAINIPLSRLELMTGNLVPCKATPIILVDGGLEDPAQMGPRARNRLHELGYTDIRIMAGGMKEWRQAGYKVFSGVFVPSKAFGEFVEHAKNTPRLEPEIVKQMVDEKKRMVVLDSRPNNEYRRMNIPTGINVPGGELVYRFEDLASDPDVFVVVNCAGRTRSIIGAQSLLNAGIPNKVVALKGGTMGWELAGLTVERGTTDRYNTNPPSERAKAVAKERAQRVAEKYGVQFVDAATLDSWRKERDTHNLYILDVRQPVEFQAGHMPDSINVQGVTVVQSTDTCVGVRNGRIVLVDDTEVRSIMAASWLVQMGYPRVYVLRGGITGAMATGSKAPVVLGDPKGTAMSPRELQDSLQGTNPPMVLDLGISRDSRRAHVPGAIWGTRAALSNAQKRFSDAKSLVLVCDTGPVSLLACSDAAKLWPGARVAYLKGGTQAWVAAGLPVQKGLDATFSPENDVYNRPYERALSKEEERNAMIEYLSWEEGLIEDVIADGDLHFTIK